MEDVTCIDCDNHQKRGDEYFDRSEVLQKELNRLHEVHDLKCDQLRESLITNARLRLLLHEKGVSHDC